MPYYQMWCPRCQGEFEELMPIAEYSRRVEKDSLHCHCGFPARRVVDGLGVGVHSWPTDGLVLENASLEGKRFRSKGELRRWQKETGLESSALL